MTALELSKPCAITSNLFFFFLIIKREAPIVYFFIMTDRVFVKPNFSARSGATRDLDQPAVTFLMFILLQLRMITRGDLDCLRKAG